MTTQSSDGTRYNDLADYNRGYDAIIAFHNKMATSFKGVYNLSLVLLVKELSARRGQTFFLEGLGLAIQSSGMSKTQAQEAMQILASKSGGKLPASNGAFYTALIDEAATPNWIDASQFVLVESSKDLLEGASTIGASVIKTGEGFLSSLESISKNLSWIIPLIAIGGAGIYIFNMSKK